MSVIRRAAHRADDFGYSLEKIAASRVTPPSTCST